jgi:hypothetical protein
MKTASIFMAIIAFSLPSFASNTDHISAGELELKSAADQFMGELSHGEPGEALTVFFDKYWVDHSGASNKGAELASRFKSDSIRAQPTSGKTEGYEFLGVRRLGSSTVRLVYLLKFERTELAWVFSFHATKDSWKMTHFAYGRDAADDLNAFVVTVPAAKQ